MSGPDPRWRGFYFITDAALSQNGVKEDSRQALQAGVAMLQYREKNQPLELCRAEARELQKLCAAAGVPFIINDNVELALSLGADGVHVGQEDTAPQEARRVLGPDAIIGVSVGSVAEARKAEKTGASYLAVSPVFATPTKADAGPGVGIEGLSAIRAITKLPLAAIGGINQQNIVAIMAAGADLICAISASLAEGRVHENIRFLMRGFKPRT